MNPLDYKGEQFLVFYIQACLVVIVLAWCLRWILRGPGRPPGSHETEDLDAYEIAAISGGERGAIRAAVASLFQRGVLIAGVGAKGIARGALPLRQGHPLEVAVLSAVSENGESDYTDVERRTKELASQVRSRPESLGLLLTASQEIGAWLSPLFLTLLVPLLGLIKIGVGLERHRPVSFLVILVIISLFIFVVMFRRLNGSTRAGNAFLKQSQKERAALKSTCEVSSLTLTPADVALAFALFGAPALSGGTLSRLRTWYTPPVNSGSGSCSSSGCGGSSCGGGCGGGGCGGCGS